MDDISGFPNEIKSYLNKNKSLHNTVTSAPFTCYDDYFCNSYETAILGHVLVGIFGLFLTLSGIILNVLLLPVLSLAGIRSSATSYMIAISICDLCDLIVNMLISVILYLPHYHSNSQLVVYQNFVAYFVPLGYPLRSLCQLLSFAFCICLLLDRIVYIRKENSEIKRKVSVKVILTVMVLLILLNMPKFVLLKIVENLKSDTIRIRWTSLANSWIFILSIVLEVSIFVIFVLVLITLTVRSISQQALPQFNMKRRFAVRIEERYRRRERIYLTIAQVFGVSMFFFKLPHVIRLLIYETKSLSEVARLSSVQFSLVDNFIDMVFITLKPIICLLLAVHFRKALKDMIGLWVRPARYDEIYVAGGLGKKIHLKYQNGQFCRSETSSSLLKNSTDENESNEILARKSTVVPICQIESLAKEHFEKSIMNERSDSNDFASTFSMGSSSGTESQYTTPKL